jgi:hypothetical protein
MPPAVEVPMPVDVLPTPGDETPDPDAVTEVPRPNDDSAIEPPMPRHPDMVGVAGPSGDVTDVIGLTPGAASSVAPSGTRAGGTGKAEPTPSGDVMPSGGSPGETCAKAGAQPKITAAVVAITKRVIRFNLISVLEVVVRRPAHQPHNLCNHRFGHYFSRIATISAILSRSEFAG